MTKSNAFRFLVVGAFAALVLTAIGADSTLARRADAGNGGFSAANADAGFVEGDDINTGGQVGETIYVPDGVGDVVVQGRDISRHYEITFAADGGYAEADASGRNGNVAGVGG